MSKLVFAAVSLCAAAAAGAAFAQASGPASSTSSLSGLAVGNTLQVDYPNDPSHRVTFKMKADGTFTADFPGGVAGSGDFIADARYICFIPKVPAETHEDGSNARCEANAAPGRSVGDTWSMTDSMGDEVSITIKPGQ